MASPVIFLDKSSGGNPGGGKTSSSSQFARKLTFQEEDLLGGPDAIASNTAAAKDQQASRNQPPLAAEPERLSALFSSKASPWVKRGVSRYPASSAASSLPPSTTNARNSTEYQSPSKSPGWQPYSGSAASLVGSNATALRSSSNKHAGVQRFQQQDRLLKPLQKT